MVKEKRAMSFMSIRGAPIEIQKADFELRARDLQISNLEPFYRSKFFLDNNFTIDQQRRLIIYRPA